MHCQRCGYLLFNLTRPDCPECGEVYDIERYRFAPGSVSFHCPHCDQPYYGNDVQGLPVPRAFDCAECGERIHLGQMRVVPLRPDAIGWAGSAWDNRRRIGFWRAWWDTLTSTLLRPSEFYRLHAGRSTLEALYFAVVSMYAGFIPAALLSGLAMIAFGAFVTGAAGAGGGGAAPFPLPAGLMVILFIGMTLYFPAMMLFVVGGIWTLAIHGALAVLAPKRRALGDTYRVLLYSYGTYALNAIPICGSNISFIWQIVTLINGIKEVHETSAARASLAVLWLLGGFLLAYLAFAILMFTAVLSS